MNLATSPSIWILSTLAAAISFWTCFGACVDAAPPDSPPQVRILAAWDPLVCGDPHRVAVELEDDAGVKVSMSAPCALGGFAIEVPHLGVYRGRIYAWTLGTKARSIEPVQLIVDEPVVRWNVETPR